MLRWKFIKEALRLGFVLVDMDFPFFVRVQIFLGSPGVMYCNTITEIQRSQKAQIYENQLQLLILTALALFKTTEYRRKVLFLAQGN